jgi:hypothetical protein
MDEGRLRPDDLIPKGSGSSAASSAPRIEPKQRKGFLNFDWFRKEEYGTRAG